MISSMTFSFRIPRNQVKLFDKRYIALREMKISKLNARQTIIDILCIYSLIINDPLLPKIYFEILF